MTEIHVLSLEEIEFPRRNTGPYWALIEQLGGVPGVGMGDRYQAVEAIGDVYGAPGLLDLAAHWLLQVEIGAAPGSAVRNAYGVVDPTKLLVTPPSENPDQALDAAATHAAKYAPTGAPAHQLFAEGLELNARFWDLAQRSLPAFREALGAARNLRTREAVKAALYRLPDRSDAEQMRYVAVLTGAFAVKAPRVR